MRRSLALIVSIALTAVSLCGCTLSVKNGDEPSTEIANPWRDCTEEEAYKYAPNGFSAPESATNIYWSLMLPDNDPKRESETMVQLRFDLDGIEYTAREQAVLDEKDTDISGMYYEWQDTKTETLANWAGGTMQAKVSTFENSDESAKLCSWYDVETGFAYSLSCAASGSGVSDVDIKSVAESIYDPAKQIGANAPGIPEECPEEASDDFLAKVAGESAPSIDISGCDTFTQIVDKLSDGMGYANEKIGDEDVLLVSSGTYDNLDDNTAAIDATVFIYKDGEPYEVGKVTSGGTAYPLAITDGALYTASNHWVCKYRLENDKLVITKKAAVEYDTNGNESYYFESSEGDEVLLADTVKTKAQFEAMFDEMSAAKIVNFSTVGGSVSALPAYEYPGPEAFYYELYKYLIDELSKGYPKSQVTIPCPIIVAEDDSNREDIRLWGDFSIYNYDLNGDILENTSGGSYPGCIHLRQVDDSRGYEVTKMEIVGDGSDFEPTAKKIFGKYYDDFIKSSGDTKGRDEIRAQIIANYVAANNLKIKAFQDYGWDPVPLPEENIDNFYSQLD